MIFILVTEKIYY